MSAKTIVYLHGFASSDQGEKGKFLSENAPQLSGAEYLAVNFNPTPRDFRHLTITGMINRLRQFLLDHEVDKPLLIGSSLGGLVSLCYAAVYRVEKMLLLAPLLAYQSLQMTEEELSYWKQQGTVNIDHYAFAGKLPLGYQFHRDGLNYQEMVAPGAEAEIIHGRRDETVPIEDSRYYAGQHVEKVSLLEVESDHRLADQHEFIWGRINQFLLEK